MIIVDTREKKWEHIKAYFDKNGIEYEQKKLDFGDYANSNDSKKVIDRKQNLDECILNLCSKDNRRLHNEVRNAYKNGTRVIFLVEHSRNIKSIVDVKGYKSRYSKVPGSRLEQEMLRLALAYGVEWRFCSKKETGAEIVRLLNEQK